MKRLSILMGLIMLTGLLANCQGGKGDALDEMNNPNNPAQAASDNANLTTIAISGGSTISVDTGTDSYSTSVSNDSTSVEITPTAESDKAVITVNGTQVSSGSASGAITLEVGENTITIIVVAGDGTTSKTYTITITRLDAATVEARYGTAKYGEASFQ